MELISKDEAIKVYIDWERKEFGYSDLNRGERFINAIESLPTVEERNVGKWIDDDETNEKLDTYLANCSECGYQMDVHNNRGYFNYCPNCGARMKGE